MPLADIPKAIMQTCLLYTSDAADERSSVDLGGRRIIKKKKTDIPLGYSARYTKNIHTTRNTGETYKDHSKKNKRQSV